MDGFLERWFPKIFIALFVMIILMVVFQVGALIYLMIDAVKGQ
jgi:hypothetical protein